MIGTKLAHYEITQHLGTGGMGEVYQAADSKLGRSVAVKLLPDAFTHDAARAARFEREARVLASLNHPNIAAIHGIEESGGRKFLVMELVPGETLAELVQRGPIAVDEALAIANQILEGLEAAHEKGIIHRDLKPANIKITSEGQVKLLDFGLAKSGETDGSSPSLSNSPTMSMAATNAGVILGTAAYMSPEQARGRSVDRRTDTFAFGCVLFEMLAGKPAFDGEDVADILSRILQREPDWTLLPPSVPPGIARALRRCLEKDARKRRGTAGDVRIDLAEAVTIREEVAGTRKKTWVPWIVAAAGAVVAVGVIAIAWLRGREELPIQPLVQFQVLSKVGGRQYGLAVSPNGRWLAYYDLAPDGRRFLFVRDLESMEAHAVPGADIANVGLPIWSPDSSYLGFTGVDGFMKVAPEGGTPQLVLRTTSAVNASWNGDGTLIRASQAGIEQASASETKLKPLLVANANEGDLGYLSPQFLPDGRHYVFRRNSSNPERLGVFVASLDPTEQPKLLTEGTNPTLARDPGTGAWYLFVTRDGQITAQPFDVNQIELTGSPLTVGPGLYVSASDNGVLAINHGNATTSVLTWYDRQGKPLRSLPPESALNSVDLSPDGSRLAVAIDGDLWLRDLARGTTARFTADRAGNTIALWSPGGDRIVFNARRDRVTNLYIKSSNGAVAEQLLLSNGKNIWGNDWSRDGRFLLYSEDGTPEAKMDLFVLPMEQSTESRKPIPYLTGPFRKKQGQFSPDGRFVAYASDESGTFEIYVQPFPNPATGKWPISSGGGLEPRWSRDGKELFYLSGRKLMAVNVTTAPNFTAGPPRELFEGPMQAGWTNDGHRWHVAPDGTFLVLMFPPELTTYPITVVVNWPELLKRRTAK